MVMTCQRQEVRVGELFMPLQLAGNGSECFCNGKIFDPEVMILVREIRRKKNESIGRREGVARERRVRDQPNQSELCHRARRPTPVATRSKPAMRRLVMLMSRPQQCRENVEIQQGGLHGSSSLSLSTSVVVTFGEWRPSRTTVRPFRAAVTRGRSAACRTSSLTASPRLMR